ncbi:MAG: FAD-dependent oxidoreductase [Nevskia sp.]|nr:FAD-dependent oxidoreductase [Nevskia sp.]
MRSAGRRRFLLDVLRILGWSAAAGGTGCGSGAPGSSTQTGLETLLGRWRGKDIAGGFVGQHFDRGHRLRDLQHPQPDTVRRTGVAIVGGGIAGLAAARALLRAGVDDYRLFELEDEPGGNSRGGLVNGFACPWGAHYVPTPGPYADELAELLTEYRLRRVQGGRVEYDEMHLCHSPQERLFIAGGWQEGLLPVRGQSAATLDAYRRFADLVGEIGQPGAFTIPTSRCRWDESLAALDRLSFAQWLDQHQLVTPALRWYLDYCCRDDYGAGIERVSAWAGLHYFASRHGFAAPQAHEAADELLTWPEGNAWLARRLAAPHRERIQTAALGLRVAENRDGVEVDVIDLSTGQVTRWLADQVILATPLFVSARLLATPPSALQQAAAALEHAPWLVANLHLEQRLTGHTGDAPLSWDNVLYGAAGLGYVNAMNQSTLPYAGATVLTYYRAFGNDPLGGRRALLQRSWEEWRETVLAELQTAHPDLRGKVRRIDMMRYGHAMAIPTPGTRGSAWLAALQDNTGRVRFAHSDLSAYSVFEEALHWGLYAGEAAARRLRSG